MIVVPTAGGCMRPWIWPNGQLHVEPCGLTDLRVGEIAVWFDGVTLRSHRVVRLGDGVFSTRGDSSSEEDSPIQPAQLLGRAVRFSKGPLSYRLDGRLMTTLTQVTMRPWARSMAAARSVRALFLRWR